MTKRPIICSFFLFVVSFLALGQQDSTRQFQDKAISFTFSGLDLGGGLACKMSLHDGYYLRPELRFSYQSDKTNNPIVDSLSSNSNEAESSIQLAVTLEKHLGITDDLSPYIGISGGVTWSQRQSGFGRFDYSYSYQDTWYGVQGGILVGIEYRLTKHISLAGEHLVVVNYSWQREQRRKRFDIGTSNSSLLLSVYF